MNERQLRWLEEAEEVSSPVEAVFEPVVPMSEEVARELVRIEYREREAFWKYWRELHGEGAEG